MSKTRAWMPLYIADFVANTMHLNATGIGIYIQLIMYAWDHDGRIPLDNARLARISKCDPRVWHKYRATILDFFEPVVDDQCSTETVVSMQHRRVIKELHRNVEISSKRKAGAEQMHSKRKAAAVQMHTHARARYKEHIDILPSNQNSDPRETEKTAVANKENGQDAPHNPTTAPFDRKRALTQLAELERHDQAEAQRQAILRRWRDQGLID